MKVTVLRDFISTLHGNVSAGQELEMTEARAVIHKDAGLVEYNKLTPIETLHHPQVPEQKSVVAAAPTSSASPAAPASQQTTSNESGSGVKKSRSKKSVK